MHRKIAKDIIENGLYCDQCGDCDSATEYFHVGGDEKFCSLPCANKWRNAYYKKHCPPGGSIDLISIERVEL